MGLRWGRARGGAKLRACAATEGGHADHDEASAAHAGTAPGRAHPTGTGSSRLSAAAALFPCERRAQAKRIERGHHLTNHDVVDRAPLARGIENTERARGAEVLL